MIFMQCRNSLLFRGKLREALGFTSFSSMEYYSATILKRTFLFFVWSSKAGTITAKSSRANWSVGSSMRASRRPTIDKTPIEMKRLGHMSMSVSQKWEVST